MSTETRFVASADGTRIAYDVSGAPSKPALVIVEGALCHRAFGVAKDIRDSLGQFFSVYAYDRRGRGESGPGASAYAAQREVEDLAAVLDAAGGRPFVFTASSGGVLALEAARQGIEIERLAVYEVPFIVDDTHAPNDPNLPARLQAMVDEGRRGEAVKTFMRVVGVPAPMIPVMRLLPIWQKLTAVAHTLPYDLTLVVGRQQGEPLPAGYYAEVKPDTLVIAGGKSPSYLRNAQAAIAAQLPHGRLLTLPGQTHMVKARATTPALLDHFLAG